mmetsp:Transcript_456/g.1056  ORF Transcript_456/g.1056 Transcript_456/m.1056 type:complete len:354 (+) Transcript_456:281-1342(+)
MSFIRKSTRGVPKLGLTGNIRVDSAIERHHELEGHARAVTASVKLYFDTVRQLADNSGGLTRNLQNYYAGSPGQDRVQAFAAAHVKVDKTIPDKVLQIANEHILGKLEIYMKSLDDIRGEIKIFQEKQSKFSHYEKKVKKLEEEKRQRASGNKIEKPKYIERLTRNHVKLNEAKAARDKMVESLVNRLNYIYESRTTTMDPIFRTLFQFQQEFFKQSSDALHITLPEEGSVPQGIAVNTPSLQISTKSLYDGNGMLTSPPNATAISTPPNESTIRRDSSHIPGGAPPNGAQAPPPPPPPNQSHQHYAPNDSPQTPPVAPYEESPPRPGHGETGERKEHVEGEDDEHVDKWFSV